MSIPGAASPLFLGAAVAEAAAYQIDRSLRFDSSSSSYLNRTPSSAGNRKTFTFSTWLKRHKLGTDQKIFGVNSDWFTFYFTSDNLRVYYENSGSQYFITDAVFRDVSAWYHLVLKVDTTQSSASDRVKIYANGQELSFSSTGTTSQNYEFGVNTTNVHDIGMRSSESNMKADFSLADVHFIDGQALAPTDFGEYDSDNNWNPKAYSGTYGTNGFHLDFSDNSSNAALGDDSSGNNNDWTVNNLTAAASQVSRDSSKISLNNNSAGGATQLVDGTLSYTDVTFNPANAGYVDYDISSYGFSVGDVIGVRYWNAAHAAGQTITATFDQRDSSGNQISGTVAATQTWTQGQKYNDNTGYVFHTLATNFNSLRVTLSNNSSSNPWGIGEIEFAPAGDTDSLIDTPTNADADSGNNIGNYAILNPVDPSTSYQGTYANGNLEFTKTGSNWASAKASIGMTSGKWYCEVTTIDTATNNIIGVHDETPIQDYLDRDASGYGWRSDGAKVNNNTVGTNIGSYSAGDIMGLAFDADAKALYFYKNNSLAGSFTGITPSDGTYFFAFTQREGKTITVNFGQRPFAYTPPTGYLSLCTTNLPDPTIADGSTAMDVVTYSGNGTTQTITSINHSPDFVWIKCRNDSVGHQLFDQVRGAGKSLLSNTTGAERTNHIYGYLSAFTSDGFTVTAGSSDDFEVNGSSETYVAWNWDGGTTTASNTDGSITSSVRANQSAGFSIVNYVGTGANATVGHGLNAGPGLIIIKNRDTALNDAWRVWHSSLAANERLVLNETKTVGQAPTQWQNTLPTSTVFYLDSDTRYNTSTDNHIAYCFTPVAGYSAFGSYTGNGSSDGPFVYTGFRPKWLLLKCSTLTELWMLHDSSRDVDNVVSNLLQPHVSDAEIDSVTNYGVDFLSNGFKFRSSSNRNNGNGQTYIYAAFAEHPFKTARAR